ncbi:serine hydrolase [Clostridium sp. HBUAS56010]|uniref:serine hydrolase n=1 Tax=Clostridium sp. HBUAS56010 TaxID=2571127 RepID=UPI00117774B6|nr:serine hydrolase [Clostridium sp. HBUAS56010]
MVSKIIKRLEQLPGKIGFYYENLNTEDVIFYKDQEPFLAASVIKLFIMAVAFEQLERGDYNCKMLFSIKQKDCVPSCGALTYLHEGIEVTVMDLITLMIIFSDNTATNVLIEHMGIEEINTAIKRFGFEKTVLRRKMFDLEKARNGIENYITVGEVGKLLKIMYAGTLISKQASEKMLSIMKNQQLTGKIPFYLKALSHMPEIAHKTGEDMGISHDVGIIYGKNPFIVCFCGNETDTPRFERVMADISLELYKVHNSGHEKTDFI